MVANFLRKTIPAVTTASRWRVAACCLASAILIHSASPCPVSAQSDVQSLIEQIDFERQKLVSGEFRCSVEEWEGKRDRIEEAEPDLIKQSAWKAECTFDYARQSAVMAVVYEMHAHARTGARYIGAFVDDVFQVTNLEKTPVWLHLEEKTVPLKVPRFAMAPIDPRAIGLTTTSKLTKGFDLPHSLDALDLNALDVPGRLAPMPLKIEPSGNNDAYVELSQVYHRGMVRKTLVIDPANDFIVRRLVVENGSYDSDSDTFDPRGYMYTCDITWDKTENTRVPVHLLTHAYEDEFAEGVVEGEVSFDEPGAIFVKTTRTEFQMDWVGVNKPVDAEAFRYENYGLPVGTLVVDFRLPEPEIVDRIESTSRSHVAQQSSRPGRAVIWVLIACLGIGTLWFLRHRTPRKETR